MEFVLDRYEKAVGPLFACQLSLQMFIEDTTNEYDNRKYAETIYEWLGSIECTIDELCNMSYEKSIFILNVLKKYKITNDSNLIINYGDAIDSLEWQVILMN